MVVALNPLHEKYKIKRVVVSTYQSVTGTGKKAVDQLMNERNGVEGENVWLEIADNGGGITGALSIGPMHAHIATPGPACRATQADHSGAPAASR